MYRQGFYRKSRSTRSLALPAIMDGACLILRHVRLFNSIGLRSERFRIFSTVWKRSVSQVSVPAETLQGILSATRLLALTQMSYLIHQGLLRKFLISSRI